VSVLVQPYGPEHKTVWDAFVARSKNGTFLFLRDFMEYHAHRFDEVSLVALDDEGEVCALLPATRRGDEVTSHEGLTYGGLVTDERMTAVAMLEVLSACRRHFRDAGATTLLYKTVPRIYHRMPADEDLHALFTLGAELVRRDVLSVLDYDASDAWERRLHARARKAAKATSAGIVVRRSDEYDRFWAILTANLERRHSVRPAHSLEEIELLASRFPDEVQLFGAYRGDELTAGEVVYVTDTVCHSQYSATSPEGRELRVHDLVLAHVIDAFRGRVRYFDFGISSEQNGRVINEGLLGYKEEFGARAVVHDFYRLPLAES
jgi:Acetyltransferase (GNAT) domain